MSSQGVRTPRVFILRHGETEWAKSGQCTSYTEVELNPAGIAQVSSSALRLVGHNLLIDPDRLIHVFASPRIRTRRTLDLMLLRSTNFDKGKITFTEEIAEWNYGDYEGLKNEEIRNLRKERGMDKDREWDVWSYGCEGGESVQEVSDRLERFIARVKDIQRPCMYGKEHADILLVAHGLILRCFVKRWLGFQIHDRLLFELDPGAVGILSYKNGNVDQGTLHIGLQLPSEE